MLPDASILFILNHGISQYLSHAIIRSTEATCNTSKFVRESFETDSDGERLLLAARAEAFQSIHEPTNPALSSRAAIPSCGSLQMRAKDGLAHEARKKDARMMLSYKRLRLAIQRLFRTTVLRST
ncbi:unnamed protein product [Pseudo-nitzschia multistriata]|uniref:Uncharacterized protein n=1 Tax=Pseudo-nitzschia multistriata TaxID=183589 RepID=A0A448ZNU6_9STRA|nr:unnamed protein product [Pseudo-nitzschia multistriata]